MIKEKRSFKTVLFLWELFQPYKLWIFFMVQAPVVSALYVFGNNYSLKLLVDAFTDDAYKGVNDVFFAICIFVLAQVSHGISWRVSNIAEWKAEPFVRRDLLLKVYDYVQHHSITFFQNTQAGTITSKIKGIIDGYDYILNLHHTLVRSLCTALLSVFVLLFINLYIFSFILVWYIILIFIMLPMCLKFNSTSNDYADSKHRIIGIMSDNITNIFSLFHFSKRTEELKRLRSLITNDSIPKHIQLEKYSCKFALVFNILYWLMLFTVLVFLIMLKSASSISTGDILFVLLTCITISFNLWDFITGLSEFFKKMGDFNSSCSLLMIPQEKVDIESATKIKLSDGSIVIKDLSFRYNQDTPIFSGLNLSIQSGEKIGIVGHSGAGKSTLVYLLLKNYLLDSGEIIIGKTNINGITSDSLRKQIAIIPQDTVLFHRSIADNIGYGINNPSISEIKKASRLANIDDFIESLPNKYETLVGERGIKISGGQRQRIAIARAFIKNAPIIILDEATSSLDTVTESKIQNSIFSILNQTKPTVVAIAHRLSTIRHMDRIIVMDKGMIIEDGSFEQLIKNKHSHFRKLWDNQINNMIV